MQMYASLCPTTFNHREELIKELSYSPSSVKEMNLKKIYMVHSVQFCQLSKITVTVSVYNFARLPLLQDEKLPAYRVSRFARVSY